MKSVLTITVLLNFLLGFQAQAQNYPCASEISEAKGYEIKTEEQDVYVSIEGTKDGPNKNYWLKKALAQKLMTFKTSWSADIYDGVNLTIMDPTNCKVLGGLVVWAD
jgi:hypothetical protein